MWLTSGSAYSVKAGAFVTARHVATKSNPRRGGKKNVPVTHSCKKYKCGRLFFFFDRLSIVLRTE